MTKRLFYIQNPIALLVALKIIETKKFANEDCTFIFGRNMDLKDFEYKYFLWDDFVIHYSWDFRKGHKKVKTAKRLIDLFIQNNLPDQFEFYTTAFSHWFLEYLTLHPKCRAYHFLEEGAGSFFTREERLAIRKETFRSRKVFYYLKIFLNHRLQYFPNPLKLTRILDNCHTIFTFSDEGFSDYPQREVIELPFTKDVSLADIKAVFAPWYIVESGAMPKDVYFKSVKAFIIKLVELGETKVHYKFHPQHLVKGAFIADYRNLFSEFSEQVEFIELDIGISLENIAFSSKANFYVDVSSVALYAKICGSKIFSYCDILIKNYPQFEQFPLPHKLREIVFPGNILKKTIKEQTIFK